MYTLNFPNGNSQTYSSVGELMNAARALGGTAKCVGNKVYAFVAKQMKRRACAEKSRAAFCVFSGEMAAGKNGEKCKFAASFSLLSGFVNGLRKGGEGERQTKILKIN